MNLIALESFRVFADTLNFTHAAAQRHLTQPALHKQVQNLAIELEVELYRKDGRTLHLTPAGIEVARFARETHDRLTRLRGQVRGDDDACPITISAGRGSYLYLLGQALRLYRGRHPGTLQVRVDDSAGTLAAIRSGVAHIGVTVLMEQPTDLALTPIHEVYPHLIVPDKHPLIGRRSVGTKELDGLPLICPPSPSPLREMIRAFLLRDNREFNPVMDVAGWELMMHFVSLGLGATIVNGCCRPPRGTVAIPLRDFPSTIYYLVEHPSGYSRANLDTLRECVLKKVKNVQIFAK